MTFRFLLRRGRSLKNLIVKYIGIIDHGVVAHYKIGERRRKRVDHIVLDYGVGRKVENLTFFFGSYSHVFVPTSSFQDGHEIVMTREIVTQMCGEDNVLTRSKVKKMNRQERARKMKKKKKLSFCPQMFEGFTGIGSLVDKIKDVTSAVHKLAVDGVDVPASLLERTDEALTEMSRFNMNIEALRVEGVKHEHTHSFSFFDFVSDILNKPRKISILVICMIICFCLYSRNAIVLVIPLTALVTALLCREGVSEALMRRWYDLLPEFEGIQAQSVCDLPRLVMYFGYLLFFQNVDESFVTSKFNSVFSLFSKLPGKTDRFIDVISHYAKIVQSLLNDTLAYFKVDWRMKWFGFKYPTCDTLIEDVEKFLSSVKTEGKDLIVARASHTSQMLQANILSEQVKYKDDKEFVGTSKILSSLSSRLRGLDTELELRGAGRSVTRVAPKAFLLIGRPEIGKSYLLRTLCTMLLGQLYGKDEAAMKRIRAGQTRDFIFTRNSDDKFWEGYHNQPIVYLDEVGMKADTKGASDETNEYSSFIKMVNDVCFPLPMANVEKKGMYEFDSDAILGTTNNYYFDIPSINNRDAYDRRWKKYEVEVRPEYGRLYVNEADGVRWMKPDFEKIRAGMSEDDITISKFLRFRERKSLFNTSSYGDWFDIHELVRRLKENLAQREIQKQDNRSHNDRLFRIFGLSEKEMPGGFEPQMKDCPCLVCSASFCSSLNPLHGKEVSVLTGLPVGPLSESYGRGFQQVVNPDSYLFQKEPQCLQKLVAAHATWGADEVGFYYGVQVASAYALNRHIEPQRAQIALYEKLGKMALGSIALILSAVGLYKFFAHLTRDKQPEVEPESRDLNTQEVLQVVMKRNVYALGDNLVDVRGFCMFLCDNIMLMPYHYVQNWRNYKEKGATTIRLRRLGDAGHQQCIEFAIEEILNERDHYHPRPGTDLVAVYLSNRVLPLQANISKYVIERKHMQQKGELLFPVVGPNLQYTKEQLHYQRSESVEYTHRGEKLKVPGNLRYGFKTLQGDCGLPVAVIDPRTRGPKIAGFHVAGSPSINLGISYPLDREFVEEIIAHFDNRGLVQSQFAIDAKAMRELSISTEKGWNDLFDVPDSMKIPGKVNLGVVEGVRCAGNSSIVPSPLFKKIGFAPKTKPAHLRPFACEDDIIDPHSIAIGKYHQSVPQFDLDRLDICVQDVTRMIVDDELDRNTPLLGRTPLGFRQAVEGARIEIEGQLVGVEGMSGVPRSTSAGYPYCMLVSSKGKKDFFGEDGEYDFDTPEARRLESEYNTVVLKAKEGVRMQHVFMDFMKDERRPKEKVNAGKTRNISACPILLATCLRSYFGSFIQHFMANRIYNQSAMGVNVYSEQWDLIAEYLGKDSRYIAGDFSNYDGKLPYCVMIRFLDTVTEFYRDRGSDNERIRNVLFQDCVNSRHIKDGVIYEWVGSNASGNPLTTVLNSWCNLVMLRYACLKCVGSKTHAGDRAFLARKGSFLRFMVYGDDNIIALGEDKQGDMITQASLTKAFAEMGQEYTDESKGEKNIGENRRIGDISFLKREWKENSLDCRRQFLSPLALGTILESIQWTKKQDYDFDANKSNVQGMLCELSQHERSVFDEWSPKIVKACQEELGFTPIPNTYAECQKEVLSRCEYIYH